MLILKDSKKNFCYDNICFQGTLIEISNKTENLFKLYFSCKLSLKQDKNTIILNEKMWFFLILNIT